VGHVSIPEEILDGSREDECYERARQKLVDLEMDKPRADDLDAARGVLFGSLAGLALILWAGYAIARWLA
jgi:hypothetical protein